MAFECMEDCIHLKACRRIQAIGRKHRLMVPRYCTEDCTAYQSGDTVIHVATLDDVRKAVDWAVDEIKYGQDYVNVNDIKGYTLSDLIDMSEDEEYD